MGRCVNLKWKRKDALAGGGRGTDEETNLTLASNDHGFSLRSGGSQLNDDNDSRRGSNRHHCVHDDAELTMIRVSAIRVKVRGLRDNQHGQQEQTNDRDDRQNAGRLTPLGAALAAKYCSKPCQWVRPSGPILQKALIRLDAASRRGLQ
jgi:hypothetical protein